MSNIDATTYNMRFLLTDCEKLDPNRPRKVGIYARVSTQHEAQIHALKNQLQWYDEELKKHANWTVVDYYIDEGITGTQAKKRKDFLRMIEDAEQGKIDLIVTREVSRFSRNAKETLAYSQDLEAIGVEIYFISQDIWSFTEQGKQLLYFLAYFAEKESQSTSARVKAGQAISRENCELYGNGNILGYSLVKRKDKSNTYEIVPEEAETVRMIFDLYLNNYGFVKIANVLTERKRKTATGGIKWSQQTIRRIIMNATYAGLIGYNKSRSSGFLTQKRINNLDMSTFEYVQGDFEPIVPLDVWHKAQQIREGKTTRSVEGKKARIVGKQVSSDIWVQKMRCPCGCGFRKDKWYTYADGTHSYGYTCYNQLNHGSKKKREQQGLDAEGFCDIPMTASWKMDCMAEEVMEQLWDDKYKSLHLAISWIRQYYQDDSSETARMNNEVIQAKIDRLKNRIDGYIDMKADGEMTKEEYTQKRSEAEAEIAKMQAELSEPKEDYKAERMEKLIGIIETLQSLVRVQDGKINDDIIEHYVSQVVPVGNNTFEWYLNLTGKNKAKATVSVNGRKNKEVIKLEEIIPLSSDLIPQSKNSPLSATPHRLLSRANSNNKSASHLRGGFVCSLRKTTNMV